ncbi:oxidoreductase [Streptomyces sp. J2-1]|uniref:oxidoreductase n=1 Tax=Streptomyces corallincola TaxID=2851888 RepID=UPI001C38D4A4|nr:oxidoreductase [Streptomyces corallincola]MBV2357150.1 oxidoreductase [Streptomyces corallincola]
MFSPAPSRRPDRRRTAEEARLLDAAEGVVPMLAAYAEETEASRRLAEPVAKALTEAGLLRLATPRVFGGHEASARIATEIGAVLAHGCASGSWVTGIAYGGARFAAQYPEEVRRSIWEHNPDSVVCGSVSPQGNVRYTDDGAVIGGRWGWASGIRHAEWALLGLRAPEEGTGDRVLALLPIGDIDVEDSWYVAGMRGTGSETAVADEVSVPAERLLSYVEVAGGIGRRRYPGEPRVTVPLSINLPLVGTAVGLAEAVLARVIDSLAGGRRRPSALYGHAADAVAHQLNVADAAMLIDTAWLHVLRAADELDELSRAGERPDLATRARMRLDSTLAMRCARDAVDKLMDTAGAGGFADGSFTQRAWRDLETASRHVSFSSEVTREIYGRVLLNRPVPDSPVI